MSPCVAPVAALYEKAEIKAPEDKGGKHLIIGVTSDRGLCGAIHSGVAKTIKNEIANLTGAGKEVMVVNVGDKLRGLLHRWDVAPVKALNLITKICSQLIDGPFLASSPGPTASTSSLTARRSAASRPALAMPPLWPPSC